MSDFQWRKRGKQLKFKKVIRKFMKRVEDLEIAKGERQTDED